MLGGGQGYGLIPYRLVGIRVGVYCGWHLAQTELNEFVEHSTVPRLEGFVPTERSFGGLARWP